MKIEVFASRSTGGFDKSVPKIPLEWNWRTKVNGRITASAHGYSRRRDAERAAVNHGYAFLKVLRLATPLSKRRDMQLIRAAIKVVE